MRILANILAFITQKPREKVVIQWSNVYWVSNLFRLWELIFWRREGIRHETTTRIFEGKPIFYAHTWEAALCWFECRLREMFTFKFVPFKIYVPVLMTPQGIPFPASPYLFAIALNDSPSQVGNAASVTVTAGTNIAAVCFVFLNPTTAAASCTLGISSMTQIGTQQTSGSFSIQLFVLGAPPTGSQVITQVGGTTYLNNFATFSGVDQTSPVDNSGASFGKAAAITATTPSVVASNCWLIGFGGFSGGGITGQGNDFSIHYPSGINDPVFLSSNATIGTGARTGSYTTTGSSSSTCIFIAAIQPPNTPAGPTNWKTYNTNVKANIKTLNTNTLANIKTYDTIS